MSAFAVAHLQSVDWCAGIEEYLRCIDDTLLPFDGVFRVHGDVPEVVDGVLPGHLVIIEFPDMEQARAWYASAAYQRILPLRLGHSVGAAALVPGVPAGYRARSLLLRH